MCETLINTELETSLALFFIGTSIKRSLDAEFEKALVRATSKKQKNTLQYV